MRIADVSRFIDMSTDLAEPVLEKQKQQPRGPDDPAAQIPGALNQGHRGKYDNQDGPALSMLQMPWVLRKTSTPSVSRMTAPDTILIFSLASTLSPPSG